MSSSMLANKNAESDNDSLLTLSATVPQAGTGTAISSKTKKTRKSDVVSSKYNPPKRPKSLMQHRADLKRKEQRQKMKKLQKDKQRETGLNAKAKNRRKPIGKQQSQRQAEERTVMLPKKRQRRHSVETRESCATSVAAKRSNQNPRMSSDDERSIDEELVWPKHWSPRSRPNAGKNDGTRRNYQKNVKSTGMESSDSSCSSDDTNNDSAFVGFHSGTRAKRQGALKPKSKATNTATEVKKSMAPPSTSLENSSTSFNESSDHEEYAPTNKKVLTTRKRSRQRSNERTTTNLNSCSPSASIFDEVGDGIATNTGRRQTKAKPTRRGTVVPRPKKKTTTSQAPNIKPAVPDIPHWTEVLLPGHLLADEVRDYISRNSAALSASDVSQLNDWVSNVQQELHKQNKVTLENIRLVKEFRELNRGRNKLQDELLQQKKQIQVVKQEGALNQAQVQDNRDGQTTEESANQFLLAFKSLSGGRHDD